MPKNKSKKLTKKEVQAKFITLMNSCAEGYSGEWDPSGEGRDGFKAMYNGLKKLADNFDLDISTAEDIKE